MFTFFYFFYISVCDKPEPHQNAGCAFKAYCRLLILLPHCRRHLAFRFFSDAAIHISDKPGYNPADSSTV